MNILVITPWLPYPSNASGGHSAIYHGIKACSEFANVYLTYYAGRKDTSSKYLTDFEKSVENHIHVYPYVRSKKLYTRYEIAKILWQYKILNKLFKNIADYKVDNMSVKNIYPNDYIEYVLTLIDKLDIDIVQMELMGSLPLVISMPNKVKTVFVHHEISYVVKDLAIQRLGYNYYRKIQYEMAKECEISLLNRYDRVITLSEIDAKKLTNIGVKDEIVRNSYSIVSSPSRIDKDFKILKILTFLGPEFHPLDKIGLLWFLENCWDNLKKQDNDYKLHIIGKWSEKAQTAIKSKYRDVIFLGFVEDLSDALIGTTLIVPITIGSGIRMKILDAVGRKVPFVSTIIGAEGLPFVSGENCYITDEPDEFVLDIIKLQNHNVRREFVESAYNIYKNTFTMNALVKQRKTIFEELLNCKL